MNATQKVYSVVFADFYALLLKTQNYHWHVKGPQFRELHLMFEDQYENLFKKVDVIAERMLAMEFSVPATLAQLHELKTIRDGEHNLSAAEMLLDLTHDYVQLIENVYELLDKAKENEDEASLSLFSDILVDLEKTLWMLKASSGGF